MAPATSMRFALGRRASERNTNATSMAAAPIGTLMNSTQRQDNSEVRTPPSATPAAPPAPPTALQTPIDRTSRGPVNVVTMMVRVAGDRTAPPTPWRARAVVSQAAFSAKPPTRLAAENNASPDI